MNITIYGILAAILTIFFIASFVKQRKPFQLAFAIWIPSTMLQYLDMNRTCYNVLSVVELILFAAVLFLLWKDQQNKKKSAKEDSDE